MTNHQRLALIRKLWGLMHDDWNLHAVWCGYRVINFPYVLLPRLLSDHPKLYVKVASEMLRGEYCTVKDGEVSLWAPKI